MKQFRKIAVLTSTRADFGHLKCLLQEIEADPDLSLELLVTGTHLLADYGHTVTEIEAEGLENIHKLPIAMQDDSASGIASIMADTLQAFTKKLQDLNPDIFLVLGDRFEALAATQAAMLTRIPIAHIHGGEATEGLLDEAIRHAITKMAHIHFPVTEVYRQRVIQLGESPAMVFNFGAPGIDGVLRAKKASRAELSEWLAAPLRGDYCVVTYHPLTLDPKLSRLGVDALVAALETLDDLQVIVTAANADPESQYVQKTLQSFAERHRGKVFYVSSMGAERYYGAVREAAFVIGNSSSGLIEVPAIGTPSINIGGRQAGRLRSDSVIDCTESETAILEAIKKARTTEFRLMCQKAPSVYGSGEASKQIKNKLKTIALDSILQKQFFELPEGYAYEDL